MMPKRVRDAPRPTSPQIFSPISPIRAPSTSSSASGLSPRYTPDAKRRLSTSEEDCEGGSPAQREACMRSFEDDGDDDNESNCNSKFLPFSRRARAWLSWRTGVAGRLTRQEGVAAHALLSCAQESRGDRRARL